MPSSLLLAAMATIMTVSISWVGAQTSCKDRCGMEFYRGYMCQCDYGCLAHEECCTDYESQCTERHSCKGRCGEAFKRGRRCTCDPECIKFSNCCPDYKNHCDAAAEDEAELQKWTSADDPLISPVAPQDNYDEFSNDFYEPNFPNLPDDPLSKEDFETISVPKPTQAILPDMDGSDLTKPFNQDIALPDSDLQTRQEFGASGTDGYETIEPSVPLIYPTDSTTYPDLTTNPTDSTTYPDLTTNPTDSTTYPDLTTNPTESTTYPDLTTNPTESTTYPDLTTNPTESTTYPDLTMTPTSRVDVTPSVVPGTTGATQAFSSSEASTSSVPTPSSPGPQSDTLSTLLPSTTDPTVKGNQEEGRVSSTPTTSEPTTTPQAGPNRPLPNRLTPAANKPSWGRPTPKPNQRPSYQADDSNDMNLCSGRPVGAVTTLGNGTIVVFRGHYFWQLDRNRVPGPARRITQVWGVPSPVDTAFTRCNCQGKTYIFKGSLYWRFHNDVVDPGYPKFIHHGFDGLRGHITAALSVPQYQSRRESVYFFKRGGLVQKYSYQLGTGSTCGKKPQYSINIVRHRMARQAVSVLEPSIRIRTSWRGFPTSITSAVSVPSRRTPEGYKYYVFSRSTYYNVQMNTPRPAIVVPPVQAAPQQTSNAFFRCP